MVSTQKDRHVSAARKLIGSLGERGDPQGYFGWLPRTRNLGIGGRFVTNWG
jgi:hypothetical protein